MRPAAPYGSVVLLMTYAEALDRRPDYIVCSPPHRRRFRTADGRTHDVCVLSPSVFVQGVTAVIVRPFDPAALRADLDQLRMYRTAIQCVLIDTQLSLASGPLVQRASRVVLNALLASARRRQLQVVVECE